MMNPQGLPLVVLLSLAACSGEAPTTPPVDAAVADLARPPQCTPGAQVACACLGGGQGVQLCFRDGTFSDCECPDASTSTRDVSNGEPLPMQPRGSAPYDQCTPRDSQCTNGTMCLRALVTALDAGSVGYTCTVTCATTRDCPGYIDGGDRQPVECLMLGGLRQCVRNCLMQADCATSLTSCVRIESRQFSVCAP